MSDDVRQEFILLSDVLGVSMLVETINHRTGGTATESTVLGPVPHGRVARRGSSATTSRWTARATPCLVSGRVTGPDGEPLAGASVDVWQANEDGFYDVQQPGVQPQGNLRGLFTADERRPVLVPLGRARATTRSRTTARSASCWRRPGRHPNRPAHLHFIVAAPGYRPVTTHVFVADSPYLDSDAVFGVKESLVRDVARGRRPGPGRASRPAQPVPHADLRPRPAERDQAPALAGEASRPGAGAGS